MQPALQEGQGSSTSDVAVFGEPLASIGSRTGLAIPSIMSRCLEWLDQGTRSHTPHLWRSKGDARLINRYRALFNRDIPGHVIANTEDPSTVTGLALQFLKEIPGDHSSVIQPCNS